MTFVEGGLKKVDRRQRDDLLQYRKKGRQTIRVPLVLTFSRTLPNIGGILRRHFPTLHRSAEIKQVFPEVSLVACRRDSNIQDIPLVV